VAFKTVSSSKSKGKAKQDTSSEDDSSSFDNEDDEKMAFFFKRFDKFMVKKGYHARRKNSSSRNKDEPRRCFKCNNKDHLIADCPCNSDNDDNNKKSKKKNKKEKKEKKDKMTFKKKKNVLHMWSLGIVILPQVMMMIAMMTRPLRRRLLQALL
jgi:hypothetical protein